MAKGKRAKQSNYDGRGIIAGLIALLIVVQLLMLNETIRGKLSIVDFFEGQKISVEKK